MLILSICTATSQISAALWRDGALLSETAGVFTRPHAETLLPAVTGLLSGQGLDISAVDAFACASGPGSYTGIRIGVSTIKGIAYALGKPAIGVSTLHAMAWPCLAVPGLIVGPVLDARNGRVYAAAWLNGSLVIPEVNLTTGDFLARLGDIARNLPVSGRQQPVLSRQTALLIGDNRPLLSASEAAGGCELETVRAPAAFREPRASCVAEIAERNIVAGLRSSPQDLAPHYVNLSQAERKQAERKPAGLDD